MWWATTPSRSFIMHSCDQLCGHAHRPWTRLVCNNWLGEPIANTEQVFQIAGQLVHMGYDDFFISPRGITDATYGIQIWCTQPEMQFVIMLHAAPVVSMRSYTSEQFEDQIRTMCSWRRM